MSMYLLTGFYLNNNNYDPHHKTEWVGRIKELDYEGELFLLLE